MKDILEFVINRVSYLLVKPECGGEWSKICVNAGKEVCKECQQEQCDSAGGGMPEPSEYTWKVIRRKKGTESD